MLPLDRRWRWGAFKDLPTLNDVKVSIWPPRLASVQGLSNRQLTSLVPLATTPGILEASSLSLSRWSVPPTKTASVLSRSNLGSSESRVRQVVGPSRRPRPASRLPAPAGARRAPRGGTEESERRIFMCSGSTPLSGRQEVLKSLGCLPQPLSANTHPKVCVDVVGESFSFRARE